MPCPRRGSRLGPRPSGAAAMSRSVPVPFRVIAVLGLLWNLYGLAMFWLNLTISPEAVAALPDAQREITLAMPRWIMLPSAIATIGGVLGMLALLLRRRWATPLLLASLLALVVQFVAVYATTTVWDLTGAAGAVFPLLLWLVALGLWLYARRAAARGWLRWGGSAAAARLEHRVGRAQAQRLAAGGAPGAVVVVPGVHVQVRPLGALGHEALQAQRGGDRAGHARAGIGDVGDMAGQVAQVGAPQRHPPQRVALALAGREPVGGERVVVGEQRRQVGAERDPRRAGEGGEVQHQVGPELAGQGQRVAQHH